MKPNTVFCVGSSEYFGLLDCYFIIPTQHFAFYFQVPNCIDRGKPCVWNTTYLDYALVRSLYCDKHGHFPLANETV